MYAYITGKIIEKTPNFVIIDNQRIGYLINISLNTFENLPNKGKDYTLYIYHYVRDNDIKLYGFSNKNEKELFELLISVSKIGPNIALSILSKMSANSLSEAILNNDADLLSTIPGIGKKTAQRIIIDLKEKIDKYGKYTDYEIVDLGISREIINDAESALISLGYPKNRARKEIINFLRHNKVSSSENLIKGVIRKNYNR